MPPHGSDRVSLSKSTTDGEMDFMQKSPVVKRSIVIADHLTSVSLEDEFWED